MEWFKKLFTGAQLAGFARHAITAVGSYFILKGFGDQSLWDGIAGVVSLAVSQIWSSWNTEKTAK